MASLTHMLGASISKVLRLHVALLFILATHSHNPHVVDVHVHACVHITTCPATCYTWK